MDYFGKGEMLTNRDVNKFVDKIREKYVFCAYVTFQGSFISAHVTLHVAFIFLFGVYISYQVSCRRIYEVKAGGTFTILNISSIWRPEKGE